MDPSESKFQNLLENLTTKQKVLLCFILIFLLALPIAIPLIQNHLPTKSTETSETVPPEDTDDAKISDIYINSKYIVALTENQNLYVLTAESASIKNVGLGSASATTPTRVAYSVTAFQTTSTVTAYATSNQAFYYTGQNFATGAALATYFAVPSNPLTATTFAVADRCLQLIDEAGNYRLYAPSANTCGVTKTSTFSTAIASDVIGISTTSDSTSYLTSAGDLYRATPANYTTNADTADTADTSDYTLIATDVAATAPLGYLTTSGAVYINPYYEKSAQLLTTGITSIQTTPKVPNAMVMLSGSDLLIYPIYYTTTPSLADNPYSFDTLIAAANLQTTDANSILYVQSTSGFNTTLSTQKLIYQTPDGTFILRDASGTEQSLTPTLGSLTTLLDFVQN